MRQFTTDHRSNPKLHDLYVSYAIKELQIMRSATRRLESLSRWPASNTAQIIRDQMAALCSSDAAFFDAAAILFAGLEQPEVQD